MKKLLLLMAVTLMAASCAQNKTPKYLVLYYSQTNTTKAVAQELCKRLGADIEEITLVEPYDGTYQETIERSSRERAAGQLPKINPISSKLDDYDVIFFGYPIWWHDLPMVCHTFFDKVKLEGKTVAPFCTHEGSGLGSTARNLAKAFPKAKVEQNGLSIYGHVAQKDADAVKSVVEGWLKKLGKLK